MWGKPTIEHAIDTVSQTSACYEIRTRFRLFGREQILACADAENFESAIHKLVAELKTVTLVFVMLDCGTFPRHAIDATLQCVGVNGSERWMFQDVHRGRTGIRSRHTPWRPIAGMRRT